MIKPSDLGPVTPPYTDADLHDVEQQFDAAIRRAHATGNWPATVGLMRDTIPQAAVEAVAIKYREFWSVDTSARGLRALINHRTSIVA